MFVTPRISLKALVRPAVIPAAIPEFRRILRRLLHPVIPFGVEQGVQVFGFRALRRFTVLSCGKNTHKYKTQNAPTHNHLRAETGINPSPDKTDIVDSARTKELNRI